MIYIKVKDINVTIKQVSMLHIPSLKRIYYVAYTNFSGSKRVCKSIWILQKQKKMISRKISAATLCTVSKKKSFSKLFIIYVMRYQFEILVNLRQCTSFLKATGGSMSLIRSNYFYSLKHLLSMLLSLVIKFQQHVILYNKRL